MTTYNHTSGLLIKSITYRVVGSKGDEYAVGVDPVDGVTRCSCRAGQFGRDCRHQKAVRDGEITTKPRIRVQQRPPAPTVRRARTSEAGREAALMLDV